ncbi:hypothetical protein BRUR0010001c01_00023 [Bifidobacterium phage BlindUri1]|nr:hypothetical protein BRUR0010001c01_00023 [Bifidobacterium phage BlindUri1]
MRAHDRYWALILISRLVVLTVLIVASMTVAITSHGYWGHGGILVPTVAVVVLVVSAGCWSCTVGKLADHVSKER